MAVVVFSLSFPGEAEGLAGVPGVQQIDGSEASVDFPHVGQHGDAGEVASKDSLAGGVGFTEPCWFYSKRRTAREVETANSRTEGG
jgi:hypothetical protein